MGDRAAWSLSYCRERNALPSAKSVGGNGDILGGDDDDGNGDGDGAKAVCMHVFHEECITQWLLVQDKCPNCRETYFPDGQGEDGDLLSVTCSISDGSSAKAAVSANASTLE